MNTFGTPAIVAGAERSRRRQLIPSAPARHFPGRKKKKKKKKKKKELKRERKK